MTKRLILITLLLLSGCAAQPSPGKCVSIYDIWTKQHIYFKVIDENRDYSVLVHRIENNKESTEIETYTDVQFFVWQPIDCEKILK